MFDTHYLGHIISNLLIDHLIIFRGRNYIT